MKLTMLRYALCAVLAATVAACGGGSSGSDLSSASSSSTTTQSGSVPLVVSDASSDDWALVGVKVLSIALVPQGGGDDVTVFTATSAAPYLNLEQLDNIGEILGNVAVPVGTYTGAVVTVGANPGDVLLTVAADPEAGFAAVAGSSIASADIQIQHPSGTGSNLTVPIDVSFDSPLVVTAGTTPNPALDLEFDLSHPAFIVGHQPPAAGTTEWAVNFVGPVRRHPIADITRLVLRHMYGNVMSVSSDGSSITITKDYPLLPVASPETAVAGSQQLTVLADATNGTLFYDVDAKTVTTITSFSSETSLTGKYVRIAARYQQNGTLTATRIWASTSFANVWLSPEGHVLHANTTNQTITVTNESGVPVPMQIDANTQFYLRQPWSAIADATPIGTGTAFLDAGNLVRGFKVHASVVDPLATPLVAQSIDIETAAYSGAISMANTTGFTYTHDYPHVSDDYVFTLDYISPSSSNTINDADSTITGFKYWNFAFPTLLTDGSTAVTDFIAATNGTVSFGGTAAPIGVIGLSAARWADPANPTGWSAPWTVLVPVPVPLALVATGVAGTSFSIAVTGGTQPVTVDFSNTAGSATLVYQVDRSGDIVTVSPVDITTMSGMNTFSTAMTAGTPVKVFGIAQSDGTLMGYVVIYFTGVVPMS
ncbi:MAG TPA: DUF4382 domain-containing protein [Steroidobacteraceae bacterium]|jgi:hypothetical protein|nr:DUF4382 domain-containing protein [Steroidobacteraceae bacterium]